MSAQVYDGFTSLVGGMNSGVKNTDIQHNQFARGINITCRDGEIGTRPPFLEIELESEVEGAVEKIQRGKFQGMYTYQYGTDTYIAFAISGSVYIMDPVAGTIADATAVPGLMSETVDRMHFCQAEQYLVVQDGTNGPMIVEGPAASRKAVQAAPDSEVPTGTIMAYCHGRLFIKTTDRGFIAGDINKPNSATDVLRFRETEYLAGGGAFFTPANLGNITAMTWAQAYGTATGQGPLVVMCEWGWCSYAVYHPRLDWQDVSIMKIEGGTGCATEYGVTRMNEDLLFVGWNGLEDMALISSEAATAHRMTNLNTEVEYFAETEVSYRRFSCAARFDNRLLYTAIGETVDAEDNSGDPIDDYRYAGLVALDFIPRDGISSLGKTKLPAYDGLWTGVHPMGLASGIFNYDEHCYVLGKDDDGVNHLYRLMKEQGHDKETIPIECALYTRGMPFVDYESDNPRPIPYMEKKLYDGHLWISESQEELDIMLSVCPDFSVVFHDLSTIQITAPMTLTVHPFTDGYPQPRPKEKWPAFMETSCEMVTGRAANTGFHLQFCISWAGILKFHRFDISAKAHMEAPRPDCDRRNVVLTGPAPDDYSYDVEA